MKKKWVIVCFLCICIIILNGCDDALEITDIMLERLPNKIVYDIGKDQNIDLTGGRVVLITKGGGKMGLKMEDKQYLTMKSDVNFQRTGVYSVQICIYNGKFVEFDIEVTA